MKKNEARPSSGRSRAKALAAKFRSMANNSALVKELQKARKNNMLLKRAKELLEGRGENSSDQGLKAEPPRLKRICWCWGAAYL